MWEINVGNQFATFLYSLCLGAVLCLFYDVLRALRKVGYNSFWTVFIGDIFFWTVSAFATFVFLLARTYGEIRGYVIASEFFGFVIFRLIFSRLFLKVFEFIFASFKKLYFYLDMFFTVIYNKTERAVLRFFNVILNFFMLIAKKFKKLLKSIGKVLYTNKNNNCDTGYVSDEKT